MTVVFTATAVLLTGVFGMHRRAVEAMVLSEGLERFVYFEEVPERERGVSREQAEESFLERIRVFYGCGDAGIAFSGRKEDFRISGIAADDTVTEISVRNFDPEKALRRMTAIREIMEGAAGGDPVPEGDQP